MEPKNILVINGILHGHFPGTVEIVKQLVSLGYNVTCYVLDIFVDRIKNVGAKIVPLNLDLSDFKEKYPEAPNIAINPYRFQKAYDAIFTLFAKDETKYDYILIDCFFEYSEMIKVMKFPIEKIVTMYVSFCLTDVKEIGYGPGIPFMLKPISDKYNIKLQDYIKFYYDNPNKNNKMPFDSKKRIGYQIYKSALKRGLLLRPLGDVLYFNPPLIISRDELKFAINVAKQSIEEIL